MKIFGSIDAMLDVVRWTLWERDETLAKLKAAELRPFVHAKHLERLMNVNRELAEVIAEERKHRKTAEELCRSAERRLGLLEQTR